ncbi:MAG: PEP-CTERM sorting domain-containing protein [Rubrivivax sp.]|nr:PEP-CTERM sorting domain-containing protein [Rubrivivax sp.]
MPSGYTLRSALAACVLAAPAFMNAALATPAFQEDFQSGLSQWNPIGTAQTTADPFNGANTVLNFNGVRGGGDIFSALPGIAAGTYFLSFDILGTCGGVGDCGGFIGINDSFGEQWLAGDARYPTPNLVRNDGTWQHISLQFTARGTGLFRLKLEDFTSPAGDVYFDNICVSSSAGDSGCPARASVPEPSALALAGLALLALGLSRRKA